MDRSFSRTSVSDIELILICISSCLVIFYFCSLLFDSPIPLLASVFIGSNMLSRTRFFQDLLNKFRPQVSNSNVLTSVPVSHNANYYRFQELEESTKIEILTALKSLKEYSTNSLASNDRRRRLFSNMSWRQQQLCKDVGYLDKLKLIDRATLSNQQFLDDIAENSIGYYGISFRDFDLLKLKYSNHSPSSTNYRVIETISHFMRDWSKEHEDEIKPMINYITKQLNTLIPVGERKNTVIVVPGSGLGRIAHEVSLIGKSQNNCFGSVHAVEYSALMHLSNKFIYSSPKPSYLLYPHISSCSNYYDTKSQMRSTKLVTDVSIPDNLHLHQKDFCQFKIPEKSKYTNVVIISAFFIDTAENLVDYLDKIKDLSIPSLSNKPVSNGYWINVGPLKYGTAAQVELNSEELAALRKEMGWKDFNYIETLNNENNTDLNNGLVGYITDKKSMWQGYYGLSMWTSLRKENKRK